MRRRAWPVLAALVLALLLPGCGRAPGAPTATAPPTPVPTPEPAEALTWLHGFYAISSYAQLGLADEMDAVSLGWARMCFDAAQGPYISTTAENGNGWVVPEGAELVTGYLEERGVAYNLSVFTSAANRTTLPDGTGTSVPEAVLSEDYREAAAEAVVRAGAAYGGVTLDFEELGPAALREAYTAFVALVREKLPPEKTLFVAVPPNLWYAGYDYRALGEICDRVILMAHDYQWRAAPEGAVGTYDTDTPVAPLGRVEAALRAVTDPETGVADVSKVALAISFSSAAVEVDEDGVLLSGKVWSPGPGTLARRLTQSDAQPGWSEVYASPYVYYHDEAGTRYRVWYEDARSVEAKIDLALRYQVTGLSLWRLGAIPNYESYDVWPAILERLA